MIHNELITAIERIQKKHGMRRIDIIQQVGLAIQTICENEILCAPVTKKLKKVKGAGERNTVMDSVLKRAAKIQKKKANVELRGRAL